MENSSSDSPVYEFEKTNDGRESIVAKTLFTARNNPSISFNMESSRRGAKGGNPNKTGGWKLEAKLTRNGVLYYQGCVDIKVRAENLPNCSRSCDQELSRNDVFEGILNKA